MIHIDLAALATMSPIKLALDTFAIVFGAGSAGALVCVGWIVGWELIGAAFGGQR